MSIDEIADFHHTAVNKQTPCTLKCTWYKPLVVLMCSCRDQGDLPASMSESAVVIRKPVQDEVLNAVVEMSQLGV